MSLKLCIGSSAPHSATNPVHPAVGRAFAFSTRLSTTCVALALIWSLIRRICFGVNAAAISRRILVCRGGSIAMIDCAASTSSAGAFSPTIPGPDRKSSCAW